MALSGPTVASLNLAASWHTDAAGYADVYLEGPPDAAGEVTAHIGGVTCIGAL